MIPQPTAPAPAAIRTAWERADVTLQSGLRIATFSTGRRHADGPTLLLIHGMGHWTQAAWDSLAPFFSTTHRVIAFDLPGFGVSEKPDVAYSLDFFAETVARVIDELRLDRVALVGHSLGGLVAAVYAAAHPERVRVLGLIDPAGFVRSPALVLKIAGSRPVVWLFGMLKPARSFVRRTFSSAVFDPEKISEAEHERAFELSQDPAMRRAFASVYANSMRAFLKIGELHARLATYRGPALIVWGREDRFVPIGGLASARLVYPQAGILEIQACGHCPNVEYPELVAARLRAEGA